MPVFLNGKEPEISIIEPHISRAFDAFSSFKHATMKFLLLLLTTTATSMSFAKRQFGLASRSDTPNQALASLYNPEQYLAEVLLHLTTKELKNGNVKRAKTLMNQAMGRVDAVKLSSRGSMRRKIYVNNKRRQQQKAKNMNHK